MNESERNLLLSEIVEIKEILEHIPIGNVIDRKSYLSRLRRAEQLLETVPAVQPDPAKTLITFRGAPVVGQHGILAEFGLAATGAYAHSISVFAAAAEGHIAMKGRLPGNPTSRLLITGIAHGSFGFQIEEVKSNYPEQSNSTAISKAMYISQKILSGTLDSDDSLSAAISEAHPRGIETIRKFLQVVEEHDAYFGVQIDDHKVSFESVIEVQEARTRLDPANLSERITEIDGNLEGVLPTSRTFEFFVNDDGSVIKGKIDETIGDAQILIEHIGRPRRGRFLQIQIGAGKPRYVLLGLSQVR